ncbi:UNKNOWN [Stylonychia lemnae]|uniref:Uncharacterized protein n=1 Tax=Stylonychia lemnae TaxID=5949 RepID=A0A078AF81_STYLE|nr:UNKNOWN [Stylonychia lemnae]|eukprot:CDW80496.1 UNKNOWN [Stylonychia lemnae]
MVQYQQQYYNGGDMFYPQAQLTQDIQMQSQPYTQQQLSNQQYQYYQQQQQQLYQGSMMPNNLDTSQYMQMFLNQQQHQQNSVFTQSTLPQSTIQQPQATQVSQQQPYIQIVNQTINQTIPNINISPIITNLDIAVDQQPSQVWVPQKKPLSLQEQKRQERIKQIQKYIEEKNEKNFISKADKMFQKLSKIAIKTKDSLRGVGSLELNFIHDLEQQKQRIRHSNKLGQDIEKITNTIELNKYRFSLRMSMNDLICEKRPSIQKNGKMSKYSQLTYKLNLISPFKPKKDRKKKPLFYVSDHCYLRLTSNLINQYAYCGDNFEQNIFVLDGIRLKIISKDNLLFKFNKNYSKIYNEKDELNFDIDMDQDLEIALQENEIAFQNQKSNDLNANEHINAIPNVIPSVKDLQELQELSSYRNQHQQMKPISQVLQYRLQKDLQPSLEKRNPQNELMKLYTIEEMFKSLKADQIPTICGVLQNLKLISESYEDLPDAQTKNKLDHLRHTYSGELLSILDENIITIILIEEGFSNITQNLLIGPTIVVLHYPKRQLSSNLEIYLETKINEQSIHIIANPEQNFLSPKQCIQDFKDQQLTMINYISPEIITRNQLLIKARIIDINFIKFEFVCQLCKGGTLLSSAKCINSCSRPRPLMKINMRCTIKDEHDGEAFISLNDERCCKVFGIDYYNIDTFKDYFFTHGVFYYKSYQKFTAEYGAVLEFFKNSQTQKQYIFLCVPYCKVGYDELSLFSQTCNQDKLIGMIKRCLRLKSTEQALHKDIQDEFNKQLEKYQMQKQVFVNGEIREAIDFSNKKVLRSFICLKGVKIIDEKKQQSSNNKKKNIALNFGKEAFNELYSKYN